MFVTKNTTPCVSLRRFVKWSSSNREVSTNLLGRRDNYFIFYKNVAVIEV